MYVTKKEVLTVELARVPGPVSIWSEELADRDLLLDGHVLRRTERWQLFGGFRRQ